MSNDPYGDAHGRVIAAFGKASSHPCVDCGNQALDWSFNYPAGIEWLISQHKKSLGRPYTTDPAHYAARCRSCHVLHDFEKDPRVLDARRRNWGKAAAAISVGVLRENGILVAKKNNAARLLCDGCSMITNRGNMAKHQTATGHTGFVDMST